MADGRIDIELNIDPTKAGAEAKREAPKIGEEIGEQIDKGVQQETKDTGTKLGDEIDKDSKQRTKNTGRDIGKSIADGMEGASGAVKRVGSTLTNYITKPLVGAASALAGITVFKGFERLVSIDTARSKLQALGNDASTVEQVMDNALTSVKGTAYGLGDAATAAASAIAAGIQPGIELTRYLGLVGDAAAIAGVQFNDMGAIFGKVQTAGRAYMQELNQLADAGIPIYQWLADEIGVTTDQVRELASDGQISSETFLNAIEKNIGGAAKIMGQTSFQGALENMWAAVSRLGAEFLDAGGKGEGFFGQIKPLLNELTQGIDDLAPIAQDLGVSFGAAFSDLVSAARDAIKWFAALDDGGKQTVGTIAAIAVAAGPVINIMGRLMGNANTILKVLSRVAGGNIAIATSSTAATVATKTLNAALGAVKLAGFMLAIAAVAQVIGTYASAAADASQRTQRMKDSQIDIAGSLNSTRNAWRDNGNAAQTAGGQYEDNVASAQDVIQSQQDLAKELNETWKDVGKNESALSGYTDTIMRLSGQSSLTAEQQAELQVAVKGFNDITGESIGIIDASTGSLTKQKDEILAIKDAYIEQARAAAAIDSLVKVENERATVVERLRREQEKLAGMDEGSGFWGGGILETGDEAYIAWQRQNEIVQELEGNLSNLDEEYQVANTILQQTQGALMQNAEAVQAVVNANQQVKDILATNEQSVEGFSQAIADLGITQDELASMTPETLTALAEAWNGSNESIQPILDAYKLSVQQALGENTRTALADLSLALQDGTAVTEPQVQALRDALAYATKGLDAETQANMQAQMDAIIGTLTSGETLTQDEVNQLNALLGGIGIGFAPAVQSNIQTGVDGAAATVAAGAIPMTNAAAALAGAADAPLNDFSGVAGDAAQGGVDEFNSTVSGGASQAQTAGTTLASGAQTGAQSVTGTSAGMDFSRGFAQGIRNGASLAISAAADMARTALQAAKNELDIQSPSKETTEIGEFTGEGLGIGIRNKKSFVRLMSEDIADVAMDAMTGRLNPALAIQSSVLQGNNRITASVNHQIQNQGAQNALQSSRLSSLISEMSRGLYDMTQQRQNVYLDGRLVGIGTFDAIDETYGMIDATRAGGF